MIQSNIGEKIGETLGYSQSWFNLQKEYIKLDFIEKSSKISSVAITLLIIAIIAILGVSCLTIAGGLYLGFLFQNYALGFLVMAGILFSLSIIGFLVRKSLFTEQIVDFLINDVFDED